MLLQLIYYNAFCNIALWFDTICFRYHYILSIEVNYSPCLVYLHQIMDKLFSPLPFKAYLFLPWRILAAYATSLRVFNKHLKSISADSRTKHLACIVSLLSQKNLQTYLILNGIFSPSYESGWTKEQCNRSHNVVTTSWIFYLHQSYTVLSIVLFGLLSLSLFYCMGKR